MSETHTIGIIRPELVARKLAEIRNYEHPELLERITENPRLVELLWFLQYMSLQPGGLVRFCESMIEQMPSRFGTETMRARSGELSVEAKIEIWSEIPRKYKPGDAPGGEDWLVLELLDDVSSYEQSAQEDRKKIAAFLKPFTAEAFCKICRQAAVSVLPGYFAAVCSEPGTGFTREYHSAFGSRLWFIDDAVEAAIEMMDRRASQVSKRIAMTAVTIKVFDALDYALQERAMVRIEGNSRFGKTESVRTWCDRRPGLARLVSVPSSNSVSDLHCRVAEALGMDVSFGSRKQGVRERVEYVLRHSGLLIALDEGAFLVPQNYTKETAPARMNWVRTEIVDRGLPLAVVVTPQSFLPLVDRFVKKTGYAMEQFFGRNHRSVRLPDELSHSDLVAVARVHFPELGDDYLELIADLAEVSENYLQAVEAIAGLARYIARREGRKRITVADLKAAAAEVIPLRADASMPTKAKQASRNDAFKAPARGLKPSGNVNSERDDLQSSSLPGARSGRLNAELISADA
jgi:hypothetical protein